MHKIFPPMNTCRTFEKIPLKLYCFPLLAICLEEEEKTGIEKERNIFNIRNEKMKGCNVM